MRLFIRALSATLLSTLLLSHPVMAQAIDQKEIVVADAENDALIERLKAEQADRERARKEYNDSFYTQPKVVEDTPCVTAWKESGAYHSCQVNPLDIKSAGDNLCTLSTVSCPEANPSQSTLWSTGKANNNLVSTHSKINEITTTLSNVQRLQNCDGVLKTSSC